jgi:hypothetical protein
MKESELRNHAICSLCGNKIGKWLESGDFFTWDTGYITRDKRFWPDKDEFSNLENVTVREY